jgi:hypothetical protein
MDLARTERNGARRRGAGRLAGRLAALAACVLMAGPAVQAAPRTPKTLGFVVTTWFTSIYESKFFDECPQGFSPGYDEIWWRGLSKAERARLTDNGLVSRLDRFFIAVRRGDHGEDVCLNPTSTKAPPLYVVEGKTSYGMNLDGTLTGEATAKSCKHQKFETPDGKPGIDNQMYRLLGCLYGFHTFGQFEVNANENRKSNGNGMTLIEVTGVDDPKNDDDVTVTFYRSIDQYTLDGTGKFVPFASYRIDAPDGKPRYGDSVKGKIVDGEIITEPGDVHVPFYGNYTYMNYLIRDLRLKLKIAPDGASAKGMVAGYADVNQFLYYITSIGPIHSTGQVDCPALYVAAHELADGYPDPKTGACTGLSAAYDVQAVAAYVVHPDARAKTAEGDGPFDKILSLIKGKG